LGLNKKTVYFAMKPFYNDHTIYGAALAFFIPVLVGMTIYFYRKGNLLKNSILWLLTALYVFAVVFSYTRAAWISLAGALVVFLLILVFRIRFGALLGGALILAGFFFAFQNQIMMKLEKNKQDSSVDLAKHLQSIPNIASDASNRERINRWHSAIRMFSEKPVFGFGPGTYMFKYAPYQKWYEKTIISTNFGTLGNAHSEYIGPLAESGVAGTLSILAIMIITFFTGMKVYYDATSLKTKVLALSSLLGLLTYSIHGLMNNFLDTDKISAPFWGFTAIIVALDVYHRKKTDSFPVALHSVKEEEEEEA
jgi:O-antigen ligase